MSWTLREHWLRASLDLGIKVEVDGSVQVRVKAGPELVATEKGSVVVKDEDYNLVSPETDDFVQIHGPKDYRGVGAPSGIDFHTHKPELTMSPSGELSKVTRPATPTTAADLDDAAERVISGDSVTR